MSGTGREDNPYRRKALKEVKKLAAEVRRKFRPQRMLLFGSLARGDVHALSDIDLLVVADFEGTRRDRVEQVLNLAQKLDLSFPVEPFPLRPEEFSRLRGKAFLRHVAREAVEL